jgi:plasmid stabilization system protein ParE
MTPLPVEFDPAALEEARSSYHWYAARSERAAAGFIAELDRAVDVIGARPAQSEMYMHGCRRPGYWRRRTR